MFHGYEHNVQGNPWWQELHRERGSGINVITRNPLLLPTGKKPTQNWQKVKRVNHVRCVGKGRYRTGIQVGGGGEGW